MFKDSTSKNCGTGVFGTDLVADFESLFAAKSQLNLVAQSVDPRVLLVGCIGGRSQDLLMH